jgi:hypothetical protein
MSLLVLITDNYELITRRALAACYFTFRSPSSS